MYYALQTYCMLYNWYLYYINIIYICETLYPCSNTVCNSIPLKQLGVDVMLEQLLHANDLGPCAATQSLSVSFVLLSKLGIQTHCTCYLFGLINDVEAAACVKLWEMRSFARTKRLKYYTMKKMPFRLLSHTIMDSVLSQLQSSICNIQCDDCTTIGT